MFYDKSILPSVHHENHDKCKCLSWMRHPMGFLFILDVHTIITFAKLYQIKMLSGFPKWQLVHYNSKRPKVNLNQTSYCVLGRRRRERVDQALSRWAGQADRECSPTSHPWTLTLIERSMKYRWSLRSPTPPMLPLLSAVPHVLCLRASVTGDQDCMQTLCWHAHAPLHTRYTVCGMVEWTLLVSGVSQSKINVWDMSI